MATPDPTLRNDDPSHSRLDLPLIDAPDSPGRPRLPQALAAAYDRLGPLQAAWPWVAGTAGAGVLQAAFAVSARPDVRTAELATCGTAVAVGTWLYGEGVRATLQRALVDSDRPALLEAMVAAGAYLGIAAGVTLASRGHGPVQMLGIGVTTVASAGFQHTLSSALLKRHQRGDAAPATVRSAQWAVIALAALALVGAAAGSWFSAQLSPAYAAGTLLFCHATLGTAWATYRQSRRR